MRARYGEAAEFCQGVAVRAGWQHVEAGDGAFGEVAGQLCGVVECAGSFDGMEDIYNYRRSVFTDLFGDSKYIFCNRDISPELLAQAIADEWPNPQGRPSVEDYQKARGAFDFIDQKGNRRRIEERLNRMGWNFKS